MEILRHGLDWKKDVTCHYCGSLLRIKSSDVRDAGGGWMRSHNYFTTCGSCNNTIMLDENTLPEDVKKYSTPDHSLAMVIPDCGF